MRIAHLPWSGQVGGIERLVHELALVQRRQGVDVSVVMGQLGGPFADRLMGDGIEVSDLGLRSGIGVRPRIPKRAQRMLEEADVVHMHGFNLGYWKILAARDGAVLYSEHGHFALGRRLGVSGRVKRLALRAFLRRHVEVMTAVSRHTAAMARSVYGLQADDVHVVPNGIHCPGGRAERPRLSDRPLTVAFVGRLVRFKRVDRLIRAAALMDDPSAIRMMIVGSGPLEADLKVFARSIGVHEVVEFAGRLDDVPALLEAVDVVVQPSEGEPFGLAILEACCQGCLPIVFADGGGVLEVLPPDGIVVNDERDLAAELTRLAVRGRATSDHARHERTAWVRRAFSIESSAETYLALYRMALDAGTEGRRR